MLQVVRVLLAVLMVSAVSSCSHLDIKGLIMPTGDGVDSRFGQSSKMNADFKAAVINTAENYVFYVATDPHVDQTHGNLTVFNDAFRNDAEASFGVILGDCIDIPDNLPKYLEALAYDKARHICEHPVFHVLGNHDAYFNGWEDYKELIGPSVYWFEAVFPGGKDLYMALDTATGTLGAKQTRWLKGFLEKNRAGYRHCAILTHTNFFYTDNSQTSSGNMPIEESFALIDFLGRQNVSLVLQGHDHYREELTYKGVNYTVVGAIADRAQAPEYLKVEVSPSGMHLDWHLITH